MTGAAPPISQLGTATTRTGRSGVLHQNQSDVIVELSSDPFDERAFQGRETVGDSAVADEPPRPLAGGEELPIAAGLREAVGVEQETITGFEPLDPWEDNRPEAQRRGIGWRIQGDDLSPAQQQGCGVAAVDNRQGSAPFLNDRGGDEVLVAHGTGHSPVEVRDDGAKIRALIGDVPI